MSYQQKEDLFKKTFDKNGHKLLLFAYKYVLDLVVAEDMVQEAFLAFWERIEHFEHDQPITSFLYISTKNKCLNYLKRKDRTHVKISNDLSEDDFFYENYIKVEHSALIHHYITCLPPKQQEVFIRGYIYGHTHQEIADYLNISTNTVQTHIKRAKSFLRKKLKGLLFRVLLVLTVF